MPQYVSGSFGSTFGAAKVELALWALCGQSVFAQLVPVAIGIKTLLLPETVAQHNACTEQISFHMTGIGICSPLLRQLYDTRPAARLGFIKELKLGT